MLDQATTSTASTDTLIAELPEPVRRYLRHALPAGPDASAGVRLQMTGEIKPLEVVDRYANGAGSVTGRLLGRYQLFHKADLDVHRSAAARAAIEAVLTPASLLPGRGVSWRAEDRGHIIASSYLEPEQIDVHMEIDPDGALRNVSLRRWGDTGKHSHGYLTFGGDVLAERRFGDLVIPSDLTIGWRYGTAGYKPFFRAQIRALQLRPSPTRQHE